MPRLLRVLFCAAAAILARPAESANVIILTSNPPPTWRTTLDAMKAGLTGHTVVEHDLRGDRGEGVRVVSGLGAQPGIVVTVGPFPTQLVRETAPGVTLVFCMVADPETLGLMGAPNTAGVAFRIPVRNQLAAFRAVHPRTGRLGVIYGPGGAKEVKEAQNTAGVVRIALVEWPITTEEDVVQGLRSLLKSEEPVDALWVPADPLLLGEQTRRRILTETSRAGKPVFAPSASFVMEGALASNGPDFQHIGERVATLVNRIATEGPAAKLELLIPRAELAINRKVATQLKIDIPAALLSAAQKVF